MHRRAPNGGAVSRLVGLVGMLTLAVSGCGAHEPAFSITIEPVSGGSQYEMWLFGQVASCTATAGVPSGRAALEAAPVCPSGQDPNMPPLCFVQKDLVALDTSTFYFSNVTPGTWTLFGDELDTSNNSIAWACASATVTAGAAASVTLSFQAD
jgi:hypothetical protein